MITVNLTIDGEARAKHKLIRRRAAAALQREAVSRLARRAAQLEALVQGLPDAACIVVNDRLTHLNPAALELLGAKRVEELAGPSSELIERLEIRWSENGERVTPRDNPIAQALGGKSAIHELCLRGLNGRRLVVRCAASPIWVDGHGSGAIAVLTDITAQKQAEAALRENEARFRSLAVASSDLVWSTHPTMGTPGPTWWDFTGQPSSSPNPEQWLEAVHPEDREKVLARWRESQRRRCTYRAEYRLRRADGVYRHMLMRGEPVFDEAGGVREWIGIGVDLSERKQAEELQRQKAELERQLVGIVSHDLATPLTVISMAASRSVKVPGLPPMVQDALGRILSAAGRAERLMRDLLDFTRARLGGIIPVWRRPVELGTVASELAAELRVGAAGREIDVSVEGDTCGEWDPDRIGQILTNLVVNALRYSPSPLPVRVEVRGEPERVLLEVSNKGPPISAALLPRLFDPLIRGEHPPTRDGTGLGLGLYIVRQLVEAHRGEIAVDSRPEGTCFRIALPRR